LKKLENKLTRFPIFVPTEVLEFAKKHGIELDIQELTLSAIAGYFATFASVAPDSRFPYRESHGIAKFIQEVKIPPNQPCPFCPMFSLDETGKEWLAKECGNCGVLLDLRKDFQNE
jgi:hypothetical protein